MRATGLFTRRGYVAFAAGSLAIIVALSSIVPSSAHASPFSFKGLGELPGGIFWSGADGISADGSVAVGFDHSASGQEAFRWTSAGGMVGLGDLPSGVFSSRAHGASADGAVVIGIGHSDAGTRRSVGRAQAGWWVSATCREGVF